MSIGLWLLSFLGFLLETAVVVAIIRKRYYRRFAVVLSLTAFGALGVVGTIAVLAAWGFGSRAYGLYYWSTDVISHGLIAILVLTLIGDAARETRRRTAFVLGLTIAVVALALCSVVIFYEPGKLSWMRIVSRNLSFCEELLNFILWAMLIQSRKADRLLFMVSAGIGLQVTGEVIGNTLHPYFRGTVLPWGPDLLVVGSELLCLLIWFQAFRTSPKAAGGTQAAL